MDPGILRSAILGIVQGLSEFLPISSSGHLEIVKFLFGGEQSAHESLTMTVILHVATALSTLFVFRKDIWQILKNLVRKPWNEGQEYTLRIVLSMLPAGLIGFFFEPFFETFFDRKIGFVGFMLLVTAGLLIFADKPRTARRKFERVDAFWIGLTQACALLPGLSRSGSTLAASIYLGLDRYEAARFSFLMVVPLILGKVGYEMLFGDRMQTSESTLAIAVGFITAFITGVIACRLMVRLVARSKLRYFGYYCIAAGLFAIILSLVSNG